jgi:hypothetical protein
VSHFARLPIRLRLTLAFALVLGAILTATGLFLYFRLEAQLDRSLDQGLRNSVDDIAAVVGPGGAGLRDSSGGRLADPEEHFAQVLDPDGAARRRRRARARLARDVLDRAAERPGV